VQLRRVFFICSHAVNNAVNFAQRLRKAEPMKYRGSEWDLIRRGV
jgi:hypothetical protein